MKTIPKNELKALRNKFFPGARVVLIQMCDPYSNHLSVGNQGTVIAVDDIGTIHVRWDCGSSLGVIYGEDICELAEEYPQTI